MGLIDCASGASLWKGYDYFKENRVIDFEILGGSAFSAHVKGSGNSIYDVTINCEHPRTSKCNCPHANGKRIVCKHMVAVYFKAHPKEAARIYEDMIRAEEEEEERQEQIENDLVDYVSKMKKDDLREALLELLFNGPEWQYDRFVAEHLHEY